MNTIILNTINLDDGKIIAKGGGTPINNQEKSVDIVENCYIAVVADDGFTGLSSVSINVNVPTDGGTNVVSAKDVNFRDYDGTVLYSYTKDEFVKLRDLPPLPTRQGLICQEWNWGYADAIEYVSEYGILEIGATYITDDGKTRLYIRIAEKSRMDVPLYFSQTLANGVTIDWGDGSEVQTISGTGYKSTKHTYPDKGCYIITLDVAENCTVSLGGSSSPVFGNNSGYDVYKNMLQRVEIGQGITTFSYSFRDCYSLASVSIPKSVTSIGYCTFTNCYSLAAITIPNGVEFIGTSMFYCCYSLNSISIPKSVTMFENSICYECYSLNSFVIPQGVNKTTQQAFYKCGSLASIIFHEGITSIGYQSFVGCLSIPSIVIPKSVTVIGDGAFQNLKSVLFFDFRDLDSIPTLSGNNVFYGINSNCKIVVPDELYDSWIAATNWSTHASKIVKASEFNG